MTLLLWARFFILPVLLALGCWLVWVAVVDSVNDRDTPPPPWRALKR